MFCLFIDEGLKARIGDGGICNESNAGLLPPSLPSLEVINMKTKEFILIGFMRKDVELLHTQRRNPKQKIHLFVGTPVLC